MVNTHQNTSMHVTSSVAYALIISGWTSSVAGPCRCLDVVGFADDDDDDEDDDDDDDEYEYEDDDDHDARAKLAMPCPHSK
jgi:hypothetical protein